MDFDNLLDYFLYYLLPMALKIGMTHKQFWEDDPQDFFDLWYAYEERRKEQMKYDNMMAYNLGRYFMLAVGQVMQFTSQPKQIYPKKPFELFKEEQKPLSQEEIDMIRKAQFKRMEEQLTKMK